MSLSAETYAWVKAGHLIGVFLWISGMVAVYWLLRLHVHAPKEAREKLIYMERSLALMMDIASALAIGLGLVMVFGQDPIFLKKPAEHASRGWFHIKLTVVAVGLLSMHGMLRARIKKFQEGKISNVPNWQWTVILASVIAIFILVTRVRYEMELKPPTPPAATTPAK
jgi:uncharacterized membrane protein